MAQQQTVLRAFVSSPDDVLEERECIEDVINELNIVWSKKLKVRLELVSWESHVIPGFGEDPQAVINEQIREDYDIFIGIMWTKFGTPTKHAPSGTVEEFKRALSRWKENKKGLRILFFFKTAPVDPYKIDPAQFDLIKKFKAEIGQAGGLFKTFNDVSEFVQGIRMSLSALVRGWGTDWGGVEEGGEEPKSPRIQESTEDQEEEQGFIDLLEEGEKSYSSLRKVAEEITRELNNLSEKINLRTSEIEEAKSKGSSGLGQIKHYINLAASDMDCFSANMAGKIQEFGEYHTVGTNAFIKSINLMRDFTLKKEDSDSLRKTLTELEIVLIQARESIENLYEIIKASPRITTHYNRAKRQVLSVLEEFLIKLTRAIDLTKDIKKSTESLLPEGVE